MSAAALSVNMSAPSIHSSAGTLGGYVRKMAQIVHPDVEIILNDHAEGKIYSTFDAISGTVEVTASHTTRFDEIRITLEGLAGTYCEGMSPTTTRSRTTAMHNFLKLTMPVKDADYPQPRIAEAGRTYTFPFNFVIPEQLLPRSCTHECSSDHVHQAHLQLPPSLGEKAVSGKDDLAPEMTRVKYVIKAKVIRKNEDDEKQSLLVEEERKLHIVPAQVEAPPMSIATGDKHFVLAKTKSLRKGVFSGKLGKITMSAPQTGALMLPSPTAQSTVPATTMATVSLRFDPHDQSSQPPKLGGLRTKIKAKTFFAVKPQRDIPTRNGSHIEFDPFRGIYETSVNINARCVEAVTWTKQAGHPRRKNSASSTSSSDCSDSNVTLPSASGVYYTATILVPISLPATKTWIPTFHSCVMSRIYELSLALTVHTPGAGVPSTSMTLRMPVQIGANGSGTRRATLTAAEAAAELADAEEFLRPRVIEVPRDELVGNSVLPVGASELPPSYEAFAAPARQVVDPGRG